MIKRERNYRFLFDEQTGTYAGITRIKPFPENSTLIVPHFRYGFKTIWDAAFEKWRLVPEQYFFEEMKIRNDISNAIDLKNHEIVGALNRTNEEYYKTLERTRFLIESQIDLIDIKLKPILKITDETYMKLSKLELVLSNRELMQSTRMNRLSDKIDLSIGLIEQSYWAKRFFEFRIRCYVFLYEKLSHLFQALRSFLS